MLDIVLLKFLRKTMQIIAFHADFLKVLASQMSSEPSGKKPRPVKNTYRSGKCTHETQLKKRSQKVSWKMTTFQQELTTQLTHTPGG